jgi:hypothetical protein
MHNCIGRNFLEFVRLIVQSVRDFALQNSPFVRQQPFLSSTNWTIISLVTKL